MSIVESVRAIATKQTKDSDYSLYDVEYVKEGSEYFLRIYFDKVGGLSLDDCVFLSEKLAEELDKEDFINEKYYLEISSPGIERDLRNLEEVVASIGKHVYIKTYEKIDNQKEFYGDILKVEDNDVTIEYRDKAKIKKSTINYEKIAKIRLAVKF
ncbi:ribosome maturation factor RimP [Gemella cuniculi]|uniref:ribosome maturation factor RimP n=1 Tax=Gemella cuniculi TaxID=150240 RepID=UPI000407CA4E|nr:ribosome maturation factor RimP [Gemella cuniculi]